MGQTARHIIFRGQVQGVGFRFTALRVANRYQLAGMVRNLLDNTVEMIVQGHPQDIADCIRNIEQSFEGYIRETRIEEIPLNPEYRDFKITF